MERLDNGVLLLTTRREIETLHLGAEATGQHYTLGADITEATTLPVLGLKGGTMTGPLSDPEFGINLANQEKVESALRGAIALGGFRGGMARLTGKKRTARQILNTLASNPQEEV